MTPIDRRAPLTSPVDLRLIATALEQEAAHLAGDFAAALRRTAAAKRAQARQAETTRAVAA